MTTSEKKLKWPERKYYNTPEELEIVKQQILDELGHEPYVSAGFMIAVWVYEQTVQAEGHLTYRDSVTGEMTKSSLLAPENTTKNEKWENFVGKVIYVGDEAYASGKFKRTDGVTVPWCKLGDYVEFPRHQGTLIGFHGKAIMLLPDDSIIGVGNDPKSISRFRD